MAPKAFLILGAGLAGLPLAHYILKNYAAQFDLKVVLVSRSTQFYWNIAAPRAVIPGQFSDADVFASIPQAFSIYPSDRFEFVVGVAESWDPAASSVTLTLGDGAVKRTIEYRVIVVATGSDYSNDMPWKALPTEESTRAAMDRLRQDVKQASSIVVGGGGPTGIEFAGELGTEYGLAGTKSITIVLSQSLPLGPEVMEATRQAAQRELKKLNVRIVANAKVTEINPGASSTTTLHLTKEDGTVERLKTDLFVPTWGVRYNTSFAPSTMLGNDGRLKVTKTLQIPGHDNAFAIGDAANLPSYSAAVREAHVRHLAAALQNYLSGDQLPEFTPTDKVTMTVSVGRSRGVGQLGSWNAWSPFIWFFKSRHMCTPLIPDYVAGKKLVLGAF